MIRTYIRYSYGGYKNFLINGSHDELMNQVSTVDNLYDLPDDAVLLFNRGHAKMLYLKLKNDEYSLLIKGVPSPHTDTDGRHIPFEIQFIGQESDKKTMDNCAISIANDIEKFEHFLFDLFYERSGLYIKGNLLKEFINKQDSITFEGESKLLEVAKSSSRVMLFVPLSQNFKTDKDTTSRILTDLKLTEKDFSKAIVISYQELMDRDQNCLIVKDSSVAPDNKGVLTDANQPKDSSSATEESELAKCKHDLTEKTKEIERLKYELSKARQEVSQKQEDAIRLKRNLNYALYGLTGAIITISLMLIFNK